LVDTEVDVFDHELGSLGMQASIYSINFLKLFDTWSFQVVTVEYTIK